jgi:DNA-binding FadR family transcriptional regulator
MIAEMQAVKRITLPDQIVAVLRREILTGGFQPGDHLPSERELAERFGISRITLRKALAVLAQEGWIEIVQGRGNTVLDFRTSVGIEVLPELFLSCPEAVMSPPVFETILANSAWLYEQILLAAAEKAKPEDEPRLLKLLSAQTEEVGLEQFYENEFRLYRELLRIGDNLLLQMAFNSQVKLSRKLLAQGLVRDLPYPLPLYHTINRSLVKAVCAGNRGRVQSLMSKHRPDMEEGFRRFFRNLGIELKSDSGDE